MVTFQSFSEIMDHRFKKYEPSDDRHNIRMHNLYKIGKMIYRAVNDYIQFIELCSINGNTLFIYKKDSAKCRYIKKS